MAESHGYEEESHEEEGHEHETEDFEITIQEVWMSPDTGGKAFDGTAPPSQMGLVLQVYRSHPSLGLVLHCGF